MEKRSNNIYIALEIGCKKWGKEKKIKSLNRTKIFNKWRVSEINKEMWKV